MGYEQLRTMALPLTFIRRVERGILKIIGQFKENPELFLTESDLKCRLYFELNRDPVLSRIETTRDTSKRTNYVHSETSYFVEGKLNKRRVDITVVRPYNYDFRQDKIVGRKGFYFREPSIGIELKLNKKRAKKSMKKELNGVITSLELLKERRIESEFYLLFLDKKAGFTPSEIHTLQSEHPDITLFYEYNPFDIP